MPFRDETEGGKVKPAGLPAQSYTKEQAYELLIRCPEDPVYFIENYCWIVSAKGRQKFTLYDYQRQLIQHYKNYEKTITLLGRQVGKALSLGTPILTPSGFVPMGKLRIGDYVIGDDGKPTKITFVSETMYDHQCYKVKFDTDEIIADADHNWVVKSNLTNHESVKLTTSELIDFVAKAHAAKQSVYIPVSEPIEYPKQDLPIDPYLLGVWLGDGNSRHCALYGSRADLMEITSYIIDRGYQANEMTADPRNGVCYRKILDVYPHLKDLDLYANKHIPDSYMKGSIRQRLDLICGLMDTDGYCRPDGHCEFYQKSKEFCEAFQLLLTSLGIKSKLRSKIINSERYHTVSFATSVYEVFKLKRKLNRQKNCKGHAKNTRHYIQSIELFQSVPVRCIQVDNDTHLYLCGKSCIPTHNTETSVAFLLWWALFHKDQTILIASYKADFAKAIMQRLKFMYEELPWWIKPGVMSSGGWNIMSVQFENGSKIITETTTANTGRGYPVHLFYLDEFAYVDPHIAEAFWTSIYPTITSSPDRRCIITSTANTDEDKFSQIWFNSKQSPFSGDTSYTKRTRDVDAEEPDYETYWEDDSIKKDILDAEKAEDGVHGFWGFHVPWTQTPGRDEAFRQSVLASGYSITQWERDYECKFLTGNETLVSPAKLLALNSVVCPPRFVDRWGMRWYEEIKPSTSYGVMLDPSEGVERDDACIQVVELPSLIQVAEWNSNQVDQAEQTKMLYRTIRRIFKIQQNDPDHNGRSTIYYSVECNGIGLGILNVIEMEYEHQIPGWLIDSRDNKMRGIRMMAANKKNRCLDLAALIERNVFVPRSRQLVSQLKTFVKRREGVYAAKDGCKDDLVMSMVLMMQLIDELKVSDYDIQERLMFDVTENYDTSDAEEIYGSNYKPFCIVG